MIYLLIAIGSGTLGFLACAILTIGKQSDPPEYDEAISQWRKRAQKAENELKKTKKQLEYAQIKLIGIGGYSDGEKEQKERVHK